MEYLAHIVAMAGVFVILTIGLNMIVGYAGLPALGHSAFFCLGAYVAALISVRCGMSPWLALPIAVITAAVCGWCVSFLTARLSGDFLALATFGLAVVTYSTVLNVTSITGGPLGISGIPPYQFFGLSLDTPWSFCVFVLGWCALILAIAFATVNSPFGRVLRGMRESTVVVESLAVDVSRFAGRVFSFGAGLAGLSGALYAHYISFIDPTTFTPLESVTVLLMVVFGGLGSVPGSIVGATTLVILPEILRFMGLPSYMAAPVRQMLYGSILVTLMLIRPSGLLGRYKWQ